MVKPVHFRLLLLLAGALVCDAGCAPKSPSSQAAPRPLSPPLQPTSTQQKPARPQPLFREVGLQAGLDYRWTIPGKRPLNILQTIGNGCAFFDWNGDGNLDILLVGPRLA